MKKKNPWLVTFSDLITLLITFFTLIISMSSMNNKVLKESFTFFVGGPGIMDYGNKINTDLVDIKNQINALNLKGNDIEAIKQLIEKFSLTSKQALKLFLLKREISKFNYKLKIINHNDVKIIFDVSSLYYPVSFNLNEQGKIFAKKISKILKHYDDIVIMKMFTQKFPVQTDVIKNNVDLSIKRLAKLVDFLNKENINYNRILTMGLGSKKFGKDILIIVLKNYLKIKGRT